MVCKETRRNVINVVSARQHEASGRSEEHVGRTSVVISCRTSITTATSPQRLGGLGMRSLTECYTELRSVSHSRSVVCTKTGHDGHGV